MFVECISYTHKFIMTLDALLSKTERTVFRSKSVSSTVDSIFLDSISFSVPQAGNLDIVVDTSLALTSSCLFQ